MTSMKIVQFSRPPNLFVFLRPIFFHPLDLGHPISNEPPSTNHNQSVKTKHNPRMTIICYQVLPSLAFVFSINSLILSGFSFSWSLTICIFVGLYSSLCSCQKLFMIIHSFFNVTRQIHEGEYLNCFHKTILRLSHLFQISWAFALFYKSIFKTTFSFLFNITFKTYSSFVSTYNKIATIY